jgi:hypothetical protein
MVLLSCAHLENIYTKRVHVCDETIIKQLNRSSANVI